MAKLHIDTVKTANTTVISFNEAKEDYFGTTMDFLLSDAYNYSADNMFVDWEMLNPVEGTVDVMMHSPIYVTDDAGYVIEVLVHYDWEMRVDMMDEEELAAYEAAEAEVDPFNPPVDPNHEENTRLSLEGLTLGAVTSYDETRSLNGMDPITRFIVDGAALKAKEDAHKAAKDAVEAERRAAMSELVTRFENDDDTLTDEELELVEAEYDQRETDDRIAELMERIMAKGVAKEEAAHEAESEVILEAFAKLAA
jgi:hypothetical protein